MTGLAPSWALGALGLDGAGDPHLAAGVHLRVMPHPALGLPLRPLIVYRQELNEGVSELLRSDITWVDSLGVTRTAPFEVTPDNPVTGYLPVNFAHRCIWAAVLARGSGGHVPTTHVEPSIPPKLSVTAWVSGTTGPVAVGTRDTPAYAISASEISFLTVSGSGVVAGARWLDVSKLPTAPERFRPWRLLALPRESGARYQGISNALAEATARVKRGAPTRFGMHDEPTASSPTACSPAGPSDELARIEILWPEVATHLDSVLNDTSASPQDLATDYTLSASGTAETGTARVRPLHALLSAALDPGIGRLLGLVELDESPPSSSAILYLIRGLFSINPAALNLAELFSLMAMDSARITATNPPSGLPFSTPPETVDGHPVYDLWAAVVVLRGAPPARPAAPIGVGPADYGTWEAEAPFGEARRRIPLALSGLVGGETLSLARRPDEGPSSGAITGLNERFAVGSITRAQSLVPTLPATGGPDRGLLEDREADEHQTTYLIAQADPFGRWSELGAITVPAKARPRPQPPVLEGHYDRATFGSPVPSGPLFGTLTVRVRVPELLPPAAYPLASVDVSVDFGPGTGIASANLPAGHDPDLPLVLTVTPPAALGLLARGETREATISGVWRDSQGQLSDTATLQPLKLVDPRPPEPLVITPDLRYSARPDATHRANVVLSWTAAASQPRFRVFAVDETRLLARLHELGGSAVNALIAELDGVTDLPTRAAIFAGEPHGTTPAVAGRKALFTRDLFESLTDEGVHAPTGGGVMRFSHDLSGSTRVLTFYRIVSMSEQGVESDFASAPFLPYAVPAAGAPPRPLLELVPVDAPTDGLSFAGPATSGARLRVRVMRGAQPVVRYRLLRSGATSAAERMPVAHEADLTLPEVDLDQPLSFDLYDDGKYQHDASFRIRPFTKYTWRLMVQAPDAPGSTIAGLWSDPSDGVTGMLVPPALTTAPTLSLQIVAGKALLHMSHAAALTGGALGVYRYDVYRALPGERERRLSSVPAGASPAAGEIFAFHDVDPAVSGTTWRVVVLDPLGRLSPASTLLTTP